MVSLNALRDTLVSVLQCVPQGDPQCVLQCVPHCVPQGDPQCVLQCVPHCVPQGDPESSKAREKLCQHRSSKGAHIDPQGDQGERYISIIKANVQLANMPTYIYICVLK